MEKYRKNLKTLGWIMLVIGFYRCLGYLNVLCAVWFEDPAVAEMTVDELLIQRSCIDEAVRMLCGLVALLGVYGKMNMRWVIPAAVIHIAVTAVVQRYDLAIFNIILCVLPVLAAYYVLKLRHAE